MLLCNESEFGSVDKYERHVVTRHPDLPGYPGPADIELYKLTKQGMSSEREIKSDIEWKSLFIILNWIGSGDNDSA
jgi:hypothetical protein